MADETTPQDTDDGDPEELDAVADRLEAALERIGRHLEAPGPRRQNAEAVARLDGLIGRLRDVLGQSRD